MAKTSDEELIKRGKSALQRDYYKDVAMWAKDILQDAEYSYDEYEDADEYIIDRINETVDGSSYVIYTGQHLDVLVASSNWLAIEDRGFGTEFSEEQFTSMLQQAVYAALEQDLIERIDSDKDDYFKPGRKRNPGKRSKTSVNRKKTSRKRANPASATKLKTALLR
jgi:hypothetical protein